MVVIRLDRKVFYAVVVVFALALALGAGYFLGQTMRRPAAATASLPSQQNPVSAPNAAQSQNQAAAQAPGAAQGNAPKELPAEQLKDIPRVTLEDAHQKLGQPAVVFVDARSLAEFQNAHIKGAVNLPLAEANARLNELPKDKDLLIYCA